MKSFVNQMKSDSDPDLSNSPKIIRMAIKRAGTDIILLYRLTKECAADGLSPYVYSVTVTKVDCGGSSREVRRVNDISRSLAEANRIFTLISRGCVTPCCAAEVIGDLLSI